MIPLSDNARELGYVRMTSLAIERSVDGMNGRTDVSAPPVETRRRMGPSVVTDLAMAKPGAFLLGRVGMWMQTCLSQHVDRGANGEALGGLGHYEATYDLPDDRVTG